MTLKKIKGIHQIILTIPIYMGIMYRSYNFQINKESIIFTLICLLMISVYLYINNKK